jgi:hypothetical protein
MRRIRSNGCMDLAIGITCRSPQARPGKAVRPAAHRTGRPTRRRLSPTAVAGHGPVRSRWRRDCRTPGPQARRPIAARTPRHRPTSRGRSDGRLNGTRRAIPRRGNLRQGARPLGRPNGAPHPHGRQQGGGSRQGKAGILPATSRRVGQVQPHDPLGQIGRRRRRVEPRDRLAGGLVGGPQRAAVGTERGVPGQVQVVAHRQPLVHQFVQSVFKLGAEHGRFPATGWPAPRRARSVCAPVRGGRDGPTS